VCSLCKNRDHSKKYLYKDGTSNANAHLQSPIHCMTPKGPTTASISVYEQQIQASQAQVFTAEGFRQFYLRWVAVCHIPFNMYKDKEFQDLMFYSNPTLCTNDTFPLSSTTVKIWLLEYFIASRIVLISLLFNCSSQIHMSFDLWTSLNHYSMLGITYHFVDKSFKARSIILRIKRLFGPHSGQNMAQLLIDVIKTYSF